MNPVETVLHLGLPIVGLIVLLVLGLLFSCYVKLVTVLGIVRVGLGVGSLPSVFVTSGLALVLTFFVMYPVIIQSSSAADAVFKQEGKAENVLREEALNVATETWKQFVLIRANKKDIQHFIELAHRIDENNGANRESSALTRGNSVNKENVPNTIEEQNSWRILAPAFLVSELRSAFATGLSIFLPFLVIDLVIASVLAAIGFEQINPCYVSFPFKLLLFVMLDGWGLITTNLLNTYVS